MLVQSSLSFFDGFSSLKIVVLLDYFLSIVDFVLLIKFNTFENLFVFILRAKVKASDNLFEQVKLFNFISLAASVARRVLEKNFKVFLLISHDLVGLEMHLSHVRLSNVCCLVIRHQIQIKHELVELVSRR